MTLARSAQNIATSEIIDREHDTFKIVPPNDRRDISV